METFDIPDVEIFAAGEWNGDHYTAEDLDKLVSAFQETKESLKPYLKLGHSSKQSILAEDELPAAGWISNLRRVGEKLVADFVKVPKKIYELIKNGGYRRVSSEIYINAKIMGKVYDKALKAVALLGGATPAVSNLNDVMALYDMPLDGLKAAYTVMLGIDANTGAQFKAFEYEIVEEKDFHIIKRGDKWCLISKSTGETLGCHPTRDGAVKQEQAIKASQGYSEGKESVAETTQKGELKQMEELQKQLTEAQLKIKELELENKKLQEDQSLIVKKSTEVENELKEYKTKLRHAEITAKIDELIKGKKVVPAQKEVLFALLANVPETKERKFKVGEKEYSNIEEIVLAFVSASGQKPIHDEPATTRGKRYTSAEDKRDENGNLIEGEADAIKIKEYATQKGVSLKEATLALAAAGELESL